MAGTELKPWYSYEALIKYMKEYLHFPIVEPDKEQIALIGASDELMRMPVYPLDGSIAEINGVLVVKFAEMQD